MSDLFSAPTPQSPTPACPVPVDPPPCDCHQVVECPKERFEKWVEATIICETCGAVVLREQLGRHVCGHPNEDDGAEVRLCARRACELWFAREHDAGRFALAMRELREVCR